MDLEEGRPLALGHGGKQQLRIRFLWLRRCILLALMFTVSLSMVVALFVSLLIADQNWELHNARALPKFPRNISQLKLVRRSLDQYQAQHKRRVQLGIICLYLFLQAFMLPGSIFINILAGSFYGFYEALLLVTVLAAVGSSLCYLLSQCLLKDIIHHYYPSRCEWFAKEVQSHRHNLLNYVLFLRITPLLPNWFINVSSPLVSVPFRDFFLGTLIGVIPASVVAVKAGSILSQLDTLDDLYDAHTVGALFFLAFLVILPVLWKRKLQPRSSGSGKVI